MNKIFIHDQKIDIGGNDLDEWDIVTLLRESPQMVNRVQLSKLTGWCWSLILRVQPCLIDVANLSLLDRYDWKTLFSCQPQLKDHPLVKLHML